LPDATAHLTQTRAIQVELHSAFTVAGQHLDDGPAIDFWTVVVAMAIVLYLDVDAEIALAAKS
jgi:hypothetical protein